MTFDSLQVINLYHTLTVRDADILLRYNRALIEYHEFSNINREQNISIIDENEIFLDKFPGKISNLPFLRGYEKDNQLHILWNLLIDSMNESMHIAINFEKIKINTKKDKTLTEENECLFVNKLLRYNNETIYNSIKDGAINRADVKYGNNIYEELVGRIFKNSESPSCFINRFSIFGEVAILSFAWTCYFYCYCCAKTTNYSHIKRRELDIITINKFINSLRSEGYRILSMKEENRKTKLREGKEDKQTKLTKEKIFSAIKDLASNEGNKQKKYTINSLSNDIHGTIATAGHVIRVIRAHLGAHVAGKTGGKYYLSDLIRMWNDHI